MANGEKIFPPTHGGKKGGGKGCPEKDEGGGGSRSSGQDGRIRSNFLFSFSFSSALGLGWPITWRQI